jgi:hypothetical protein
MKARVNTVDFANLCGNLLGDMQTGPADNAMVTSNTFSPNRKIVLGGTLLFFSPAFVVLFVILFQWLVSITSPDLDLSTLYLCLFFFSILAAASTPFFSLSWKKIGRAIVLTLLIWVLLVIQAAAVSLGMLYYAYGHMGC